MKIRFIPLLMILALVTLAITSCAPRTADVEEAAPPATPAVSDGSEDLTIDLKINLSGSDTENYFNWKGNVRYMAAEDKFDAVSGASLMGSTHLFMMYLYDVKAKAAMSPGLRGLFLYGVNGAALTAQDNLNALKKDDGMIEIQYVHRGTAYRFTTNSKGVLSLPDGKMESRKIGTPQELETEFTRDGTAKGVDFNKVWSSDVKMEGADPASMYFWDGDLMVLLEGDILTMKGVLTAVKR